ncbi:glycogen synthase GlgA [Metabacillus sp. KIGAM252]|uniref:Glycogen synthase n=1 Tax=Metabacillus flavus TaxID=2823519 RepID=A0ABS5LHU7_9BACI|nr:glycogen synthase GlgA [Metabacillus flavus]
MKILFAVSECVPFVKSGGLADVAGALPKELTRLGSDVRVIMPKYGQIPEKYREQMTKVKEIEVAVGWRSQFCGIEVFEMDGVTYYFLDNEYYFKRDSLYGHYDDGERFSFFSRAVLEAIKAIDFQPDVIHSHDWHTGMVAYFLNEVYAADPFYAEMKTVFTIHNLEFQGIFPQEIIYDLLNLGHEDFTADKLEFYQCVNFMKAAIISSSAITTVSPTYMEEIQTPYYGERLDGLLRAKGASLHGILNGIDDTIYNPAKDAFLKAPFDVSTLEKKQDNKAALQKMFGLPEKPDVPVISMVTRLTKQKGLDLVRHVMEEMVDSDTQWIILGTGEDEFENYFRHMEHKYPENVKAYIGFDEPLAHRVYAGSDLFLMPSRFEPCGLGQLIALRYGSIPVVRETGGLNDTVLSYNEATGEGNGFSFKSFNAHDMMHTVRRALSIYREDKELWNKLVRNAMSQDYSWSQSASKYNQLYTDLMGSGSIVLK